MNLGLVMRTLFGAGTPRQAAAAALAVLFLLWARVRAIIASLVSPAGDAPGTILPPAIAAHAALKIAA